MTGQRERVSTDPGIGPVDADDSATLRSIEAAVEVEPDGASLYYEPLPLVAVSDHRTLEMETVKISQEIDPRKLPTISLPRSPVPPRYDSGWPQADLVLTSSQRPAALQRRWRVPALLLGLLAALLLLVLARTVRQRAAEQSAASSSQTDAVAVSVPNPPSRPTAAASAALPVASAALPVASAALPVASAALPVASAALPVASAALPVASAALPVASAALPVASAALPVASAAVRAARPASPPSHAAAPATPVAQRLIPKPSAEPSASNPTLGAPIAKPKRAIY